MREFYVYGFKSREEFNNKSSRSYDDERRRVENCLGDYMNFRTTSKGKNVFISIDSRMVRHNPLYKAWKLIAVLAFLIVTGFFVLVLFRDILKSESLVFYLLIIFLWTMVIALFAGLINQISGSKSLNDMIGNALPVILMFLSGSVLPIEFMPGFIQKIARFSPLFYYNEGISKISESNFDIGSELLIIGAFGIAFYLASLYLSKERKTEIL